jgi:two-component system chemotaxis response regulator CheY
MEKIKARVLIADDEPHIRSLISLIVTSLDGEVVAEATDGEQALSLFKQLSPNMVLLDINMPKMDGVAVLKHIMAINDKTLVVMLTSLNTLEVVNECIDNGAWHYILKNTTAEELQKTIYEAWDEYMVAIKACRDGV